MNETPFYWKIKDLISFKNKDKKTIDNLKKERGQSSTSKVKLNRSIGRRWLFFEKQKTTPEKAKEGRG